MCFDNPNTLTEGYFLNFDFFIDFLSVSKDYWATLRLLDYWDKIIDLR